MNVEQFRALLERLITLEAELRIQAHVNKVLENLNPLLQDPKNAEFRTAVFEQSAKLRAQLNEVGGSLTRAQVRQLEEIDSGGFFNPTFAETIEDILRRQIKSPKSAISQITKLQEDRNKYLHHLNFSTPALIAFGIAKDGSEEEAQLFIQIPRHVFHDDLEELARELRIISRVIKTLSEYATGSTEIIRVDQITTSNPTFILRASIIVMVNLAAAITWAVETWKDIESIREIRARTEQIVLLTDRERKALSDESIEQKVDRAVAAKVRDMMETAAVTPDRQTEMEKALSGALKTLFLQIDKGVVLEIEVKPLPPIPDSTDKNTTLSDEKATHRQLLEELKAIAEKIDYPNGDFTPLISGPSETNMSNSTPTSKSSAD